MSDNQQPENREWWQPDELFAPGPSALVALALALLVLMGGSLMLSATVNLVGQYMQGSDWNYAWATFVGLFVPALASAYLARRAITSPSAAGWELTVARTALVLAVIAAAYTVLLTLGTIIHLA